MQQANCLSYELTQNNAEDCLIGSRHWLRLFVGNNFCCHEQTLVENDSHTEGIGEAKTGPNCMCLGHCIEPQFFFLAD